MYPYNNFNYGYAMQPYQQRMAQQLNDTLFNDVRILTADQIKGFIPPINSKVLLIDKDNSLAYVETTDNMGNMYKQQYSFNVVQNEKKETKQDFSNFATKEDIANIRKELESLRKPSASTTTKENVQPKV